MAVGTLPSAKSRLPRPRTTGWTSRRYSSTGPCGDVLGEAVQLRRDRVVLVGDPRPVGGKDVVGLAAQKEGVPGTHTHTSPHAGSSRGHLNGLSAPRRPAYHLPR